MDHVQATPADVPQIIQVFQPAVTSTKLHNPQIIHISHPSLVNSKISYEQTVTTESLHIPMTEVRNQQLPSQIVVSCQQAHIQNMPAVQSQVLHGADISHALQFASHMLLPSQPVFEAQQYYTQYEMYVKEQSNTVITKAEPSVQMVTVNEGNTHIKPETQAIKSENQELRHPVKKRARASVPDPNSWACNVRKMKHQRGEAYISRRGKLVPERVIRTTKNCLTSCKYKCNERISDTDRENIFKAFYSLNANEKKHFLLNTTERNCIKHNVKLEQLDHKRKYSFKYFFLVRAVRHTVCKNFYLGTLAISQKPVYNVHLGKSEMNIPKPDGRGLSESSTHPLAAEMKDGVRKHIMSFKTLDLKPVKQFFRKKQYLDPSLSIKHMFTIYASECEKDNIEPVKESMYRKIFKEEFNLHFNKNKTGQLCAKCKGPIKKK